MLSSLGFQRSSTVLLSEAKPTSNSVFFLRDSTFFFKLYVPEIAKHDDNDNNYDDVDDNNDYHHHYYHQM